MRGKRLHTSVGATKWKPLSTAERRQLAALEAKADEAIDTKDIPEAPAANWRLARRGALYRPVKQPITTRLDSALVAWFNAPVPGLRTPPGIPGAWRATGARPQR